ncbi:MAG: tetratricopeptide repeat protein [Chthoniobacteraceae bacterium]
MNPSKILHVSVAAFLISGGAYAETPVPAVVERYEQILVKSPEKGTAFDKVYQYYFENEGLEKLAQRWKVEAMVTGLPAKTATYQLLLGMLAERQGKTADARAAFTEAAKFMPENYRVWRSLGGLEATEGKLAAAIEAFGKALAANPPAAERAPLYRELARAQQRSLDNAGALATWQKMAGEFPNDPFVIEEVAEAQLDAEKYDDARATYTKLRDLAGTDPFRKVSATIRLAQVEERQGKTKEALAIYEGALAQASETSWIHRDVRSRIEEVYRRQDDLPGLVGYYEKWLGDHDKDVEAATRLSGALVELNRKADAVTWLRKAAQWAPDRNELQVELARLLRDTDQADEARQILAGLAQAHPEELSYWELLGAAEWAIFKKGHEEAHQKAAIEAWKKLAPPETKDASQVSRLADLLRDSGLNDEALAQMERACTLAPEAGDLRERRAGFLFELHRDDEAWKGLEGLVEGARANAANYQRLASIQLKYGKLDAALESVKKGAALAPADYSVLALQWRILSERKEWSAAAALYEPMLAAAPAMYEQTEQQYLQALKAADTLDAARKALAEKLSTATEAELRLLARIALQADDLPSARQAIEEGKKHFPESFALARLESECAKRAGNLDERVAALRRLIKLEPKQTGDFLLEMGRAYQEAQKWDQAREVAREWIAFSPANADAHLFAADLAFASGTPEEGIAKLRDSVKLSEKPNQIRLRLAQAYSQAGETAKAQQTAEEAFEAEEDASAKMGILRQVSEYYFTQGKIDVLINRFRERQRSEEGGWRYALYLSEIFQQMQDYGQAREELAKSLASRPKDPALLKQLLRLAEQENNNAEQARYHKALAEVEPTTANFAALAEALANNNDAEGAVGVLAEHEAEVLKDPSPWRLALARVQKQPGAANLFTTLANALRQRPADFSGRMTLAELQIAMGSSEEAKRTLWDLRRMPQPARAAATPASAPTTPQPVFVGPGGFFGGTPSNANKRIYAASMAQQSFIELINSQNGRQYGNRRFYRYGPMGYTNNAAPSAAPTFEETRDKALVYLAAIAVREQKPDAFIADLEKDLAAQNADRMERFVCYSLVEARDLLWREILAQADSPAGGQELDQLCFGTLPRFMTGQQGSPAPDTLKASELTQKFAERLAGADPKMSFISKMMRYSTLNNSGQKDEAKKIADDVLAHVDEKDPMQVQVAFSMATESGDIEKAEKYLPKLLERTKKNPGTNYGYLRSPLAQAYLKKNDLKNGVRLLAETFRDSLPAQAGGANAMQTMFFGFNGYRSYYRNGNLPQLPYPNRYMDDQRISTLRQSYQLLKPLNGLDPYLESLAKLKVPAELQIYPALARVYLEWFDDKKEPAFNDLQALLTTNPDDELRLLAAGMAVEIQKTPEAFALLDQVGSQQRDVYKRAQQIMLSCAQKAKNDEVARKAALRLVALRPPREELQALLPDLKRLGLTEKVDELEKQIARSSNQPNDMRQKTDLLQSYRQEKKETEAVALAKTLLAIDPLAQQNSGNYFRHISLDVLDQFKALDDYIADLEKQAAATPDSARICLLLAEAWARKDSKKAPEWYRKVVALRPNDLTLQWKLVQAMSNRDQREEGLKLCREILKKDPGCLFDNRFDVINLYENCHALPELAEVVLTQPPQLTSMGPNYNSGNRQPEWICNRLGQRLRDLDNNLELAVKVWTKGIELSDENTPFQSLELRDSLSKGLADLGRKEEALSQVELLYFPASKPKAALLGMNNAYSGSSWMSSMSTDSNGNVSYPGLAPLDVAEKLGSLDALRVKAEAKATQDDSMKWLAFVIRARQHDPKLLQDLQKLLADSKMGNPAFNNNETLLRVMSSELIRWPEARRLSLDLLFAAKKVVETYQGNSTWQVFNIDLQIFNRAVEFNDVDSARKAAKEWIGLMQSSGNGMNGFANGDQIFAALGSMIKCGMTAEFEQTLAYAKSNAQAQGNSSYRRQIADAEAEMALSKGELEFPQAIVCPAGEQNGKPVLAWEFRKGTPEPESSMRASFRSRDLPKLDGRWDLELLALTPPNEVTRLAVIPKAKARGTWSGALPPGLVSIQAVLRAPAAKKGTAPAPAYTGQWVPVLTGSNLITNPNFEGLGTVASGTDSTPAVLKGWSKMPTGSISPGGPCPGGTQVELIFPQNSQTRLIGDKILIEKDKEYLYSFWLQLQNGNNNCGVAYLDQDGKQVGNHGMNTGNARDRWVFSSQAISPRGGNNKWRCPEKAVYMQPYFEGAGTVRLHGITLTRTDLPPEEKKPTPTPSPSPSVSPTPTAETAVHPFALACPAGEEGGKTVVLWETRSINPLKFNRDNRLFEGTADSKLDGRYDLELVYQTRPNVTTRLALIPAAKASGKWIGKIPAGLGSIQAVLHPAGKPSARPTEYTGVWTPAVDAPNLITNPTFKLDAPAPQPPAATPSATPTPAVSGSEASAETAAPSPSPSPAAAPTPSVKGWENLAAISVAQGGPRPGGSYVVFINPTKKSLMMRGEKIPVKKDKNYTLSAWTLYFKGAYPRVGVLVLDKDGKQIQNEYAGTPLSVKGKWSYRYMTLAISKNPGDRRRLNDNAVYLQPYVEVKDDVGLDCLYLGETDAPPTAENNN